MPRTQIVRSPLMRNLYFDESMHERGGFIVGALVLSNEDLSKRVQDLWRGMGLDPAAIEYKSSARKAGDSVSQSQRDLIRQVLHESKLGVVVCPLADQRALGEHASRLVLQLLSRGVIAQQPRTFYIDQNISVPRHLRTSLHEHGVVVLTEQDSRLVAGLQVADCAAHSLGGMLLQEMGIVSKRIAAGSESGYEPALELDLGFELWAGLRYALLGENDSEQGGPRSKDWESLSFKVDGYGLYVAPSCSERLASHARSRFGVNYLGCIH